MQKLKVINKYCFYLGFILIFLEAYQFFSIPLNWIGLGLIFLYSLNFKNIFFSSPMMKVLLLFFLTLISIDFFFIISNPLLFNIQYFVLRMFNLISFTVLFILFKNEDVVDDLKIDTKLKYFILIFSIFWIYIYFAQIFDFFEPFRNRSNTSVYANSLQTTFWPEASHRALGTFREPSYLVSYFIPLIYLYIKLPKRLSPISLILCSTIIGLAKSDFSLIFCAFLLLIELIDFFTRRKVDIQILLFSFIVIVFSQININECNLNPSSKDCINYFEEKMETNIFSDDINFKNFEEPLGEENISIINFDNERFAILTFVRDSFTNLDHRGVLYANLNYQSYSSRLTKAEMYLTNRTLPKYLLDKYPTQNFGTGRYSLLRYPINLQNKLVFYYVSYGPIILVIFFLVLINLAYTYKSNSHIKYFLIMLLFFILSPLEEVNSYFGFILGYAFYKFVD